MLPQKNSELNILNQMVCAKVWKHLHHTILKWNDCIKCFMWLLVGYLKTNFLAKKFPLCEPTHSHSNISNINSVYNETFTLLQLWQLKYHVSSYQFWINLIIMENLHSIFHVLKRILPLFLYELSFHILCPFFIEFSQIFIDL